MMRIKILILVLVAIIGGCASSEEQLQVPQTNRATAVKIQQKVNQNWVYFKKPEWWRGISVKVFLNPDGTLSDTKIVKSSGDKSLDFSLIRAIRKSVPFDIPEAEKEVFREFQMDF